MRVIKNQTFLLILLINMKLLLQVITTAIAAAPALSYLQWVGVLDSEYVPPPEEPGFPLVGLIDGGILPTSLPGRKDLEALSVRVVAYQSLLDAEPGAHLLGIATLPTNQGKGLLDIAQDLKVLLNDNFLSLTNIHYAHRDRVEPSEMVVDPAGRFILMQKSWFTYRRYV